MQSTNFEFLRTQWPELADLGAYAEQYMESDPASAQVKCRLLAEHITILACNKARIPVEAQKEIQKQHLHEANQVFKALQQEFFG